MITVPVIPKMDLGVREMIYHWYPGSGVVPDLCTLTYFYIYLFTFSKQSFNESLDFCNGK